MEAGGSDGGTLKLTFRKMLKSCDQSFVYDIAYMWLRDLLKALVMVHDHGIIHADIKPNNIIVYHHAALDYRDNTLDIINSYRPYLIDFGLSCWQKDCPQKTGTHPFVAPELLGPVTRMTEQMDLWSSAYPPTPATNVRLWRRCSDGAVGMSFYSCLFRPRMSHFKSAKEYSISIYNQGKSLKVNTTNPGLNYPANTMLSYDPAQRLTAWELYQTLISQNPR